MYRHVLARWWDPRRDGLDHPMVDRRNTTRRQLNRLAHRLRQVNGEVSAEEIIASGERRFSVGDRVTARAPSRNLHPDGHRKAYVRNGALGTIELPRSFFDHHRTAGGRTEVGIDHAYALTSYAVQGSTRDVSTSRVDATTTRAETYVDITRGRHANHLYLTAATDPLDGEALPRVAASPAAPARPRNRPVIRASPLIASAETSGSRGRSEHGHRGALPPDGFEAQPLVEAKRW